jgi:hypothetical protein
MYSNQLRIKHSNAIAITELLEVIFLVLLSFPLFISTYPAQTMAIKKNSEREGIALHRTTGDNLAAHKLKVQRKTTISSS